MDSVDRKNDTIIPEREKWLWENKEALSAVKEGLEQSSRGETQFLGRFAQYAVGEIKD